MMMLDHVFFQKLNDHDSFWILDLHHHFSRTFTTVQMLYGSHNVIDSVELSARGSTAIVDLHFQFVLVHHFDQFWQVLAVVMAVVEYHKPSQ